MPAAGAPPGASRDHALEIAVEGDAVLPLAHLPAQALGQMRLGEEQHRALARRPPLHRRDMGKWIKAAPVGGKDRLRREFVGDAGKARRIIQRLFGVGQGVVRRQKLVKAHAHEIGQAGDAFGAERPGEAERPALAFVGEAFAKQRRAPVGRCRNRRRKCHMVGVVVQSVPKRVEMANISPFCLTRGLMEGYLDRSKSGLVNRSLTPP